MNTQDTAADKIVEKHMWWAAGAGLVPVPYVDMAAIAAVNLKMIKNLATNYEIPFSEERGKAVVSALVGGVASGMVARSAGAGAALRLIPVIGYSVATLSTSLFGGAFTYAVGKVFAQHLAAGGTLLDFDPEKARKAVTEQYRKGKDAVLRTRAPRPSAA